MVLNFSQARKKRFDDVEDDEGDDDDEDEDEDDDVDVSHPGGVQVWKVRR